MAEHGALVPFALPAVPERPDDGHKGIFGRVRIIGGSRGMSGAVCLASVAALRTGSGLVTAVVPRSIQKLVAAFEPSVMTIGLADEADGGLAVQKPEAVSSLIAEQDALGVGPGLGKSPAAANLTRELIVSAKCPVVLDADALNVAAEHDLLTLPNKTTCVITPHPGEFSRLTGRTIKEIERHREDFAREFAVKHNVVVALKGARTIVTDGSRLFKNTTGNSGMATGGSGDVLTGIVTSLMGQHLPAFEAAVLAVHAHGLAGDIAADWFTQRGMIASDLLRTLPEAWRRLESKSTNSSEPQPATETA